MFIVILSILVNVLTFAAQEDSCMHGSRTTEEVIEASFSVEVIMEVYYR